MNDRSHCAAFLRKRAEVLRERAAQVAQDLDPFNGSIVSLRIKVQAQAFDDYADELEARR